MYTFLVLAATLVVTAFADEGLEFYNFLFTADGADDTTCRDTDGENHKLGETWYNDKCQRLVCHKLDERNAITVVGCEYMNYPAGCTWKPDPGHYPECCTEDFVCGSSEETTNKVRRQEPFGSN